MPCFGVLLNFIEMFSLYLMESLLCKKKWSNIKKVILLARNDFFDERKSDDYYILGAAKNIALIISSLVVCLCNTPVKGETKAILRNLKVNVCDCRLRAEY